MKHERTHSLEVSIPIPEQPRYSSGSNNSSNISTTSPNPPRQPPTDCETPNASSHFTQTATLLDDKSVLNSSLAKLSSPSLSSMASTASTQASSRPYSIFSRRKKSLIVFLAALSSFISPLSANIYFPVLDQLQQDMHTTASLISLTVTVYMVFQGISPSLWGGLADTWGRRPVYIITIFVYIMACIGLALTQDYAVLVVLRMLQAFGSSSVIAIGAGTIGDIATPAERGGYMGVYSLGTMLGPILGPVFGGALSHQFGWRSIFWLLTIFGTVLWFLVFMFLPETLRNLVGDGSGYANPTPIQFIQRRLKQRAQKKLVEQNQSFDSGTGTFHADIKPDYAHAAIEKSNNDNTQPKRNRFLQCPNPFRSIIYMREKDIAIVLLYNSLQYAGFYTVLTSMTSLFAQIYHLNELQIGLCYLANGLGSGLGSFTSGRILNWQFKREARKLGLDENQTNRANIEPSFPIERARMQITWVWGLLFSVMLILYGWLLHIKIQLPVTLTIHVVLAYTSTSTFNATNTLLVDLFPKNSAAIVASNNLARCLLGAAAVVLVNPGIAALGLGWFFTTVSLILLVSRFLMYIELRYGPKWRMQRMERLSSKQSNR